MYASVYIENWSGLGGYKYLNNFFVYIENDLHLTILRKINNFNNKKWWYIVGDLCVIYFRGQKLLKLSFR